MGKMSRSEAGYTLVEALVVVALIGLLVLIAIPQFRNIMNSYLVSTTATLLGTDIRFARNACVKKQIPYRIVIKEDGEAVEPNTYRIERDEDSNGTFEESQLQELDDSIKINAAETDVVNFVFNARGGSTAGNIVIEHKSNSQFKYRITVSNAGGVQLTRL